MNGRTATQPTQLTVGADLLAAIDPALPSDQRIKAATRAVAADAETTIGMVMNVTDLLFAELSSVHPSAPQQILQRLRDALAKSQ